MVVSQPYTTIALFIRLSVENSRRGCSMGESEIAFVKVQARKAGNLMVTIPSEVREQFSIKPKMKLKVLVDKQKKKIIYQLTT